HLPVKFLRYAKNFYGFEINFNTCWCGISTVLFKTSTLSIIISMLFFCISTLGKDTSFTNAVPYLISTLLTPVFQHTFLNRSLVHSVIEALLNEGKLSNCFCESQPFVNMPQQSPNVEM